MRTMCRDGMPSADCRGCDRRQDCASFFRGLFARRPPPSPRRGGRGRPASGENPFLAFLGEVARAFEAANVRPRESAFRRKVEALVEPMLDKGAVRVDAVARALGCSRQTLYRRLKAEGLTFAELLDSLRRRLALLYVRERKMPVKEAAYRLGFSEPAAFSRAYKRWTGTSPGRAGGQEA